MKKAIHKASIYKKLLSEYTPKNTVEISGDNFLLIKSERRFHKIRFSDIKYIEGLKDYVVVYTTNQKLITAMNLKTIHQNIPQNMFLRVNKSYVVNINHIDSFDSHSLYIGEYEISLGDVYKEKFLSTDWGKFINP